MPKFNINTEIYFLYQLSEEYPGIFECLKTNQLPTHHQYFEHTQTSSQETNEYPIGLINIGNTCYLNSALQSLFLLKDIKEQFIQYATLAEIADNKTTVTYHLGKLFQDKENDNEINIQSNNIGNILHALSHTLQKNIYLNKQQKDPHEFLIDIIQSITIENALPNSIAQPYNHSSIQNYKTSFFQNNPEVLFGPLTLFIMKKKTYECQHTSILYEGHLIYELSINTKEKETIEYMINTSISSQNSQDNDSAKCPKCNLISKYNTNTYLQEAPKYLIILLKRYSYDISSQKINKLTHQIVSGKYNRNSKTITITIHGITYKLLSAIFHKGPIPTQGHYISIVNQNTKYYQINDQNVDSINDVKTSSLLKSGDSYILMYERCNNV